VGVQAPHALLVDRDGLAFRRAGRVWEGVRKLGHAGVPYRMLHCCQCCRPAHRRLQQEEEEDAPEWSPGRGVVS
jgi:hypothetical protein